MDESSDTGMGEDCVGGAFSLPCDVCRRRKVRCSKTWPCSNCQRNRAKCTYDNSRQLLKRPSKVDDLNERVARLESLIQNLSRQGGTDVENSNRVCANSIEVMARNIRRNVNWDDAEQNQAGDGALISDDGRSRYLSNTFWATMYDEITNFKIILEDEQNNQGQHPSLPGAAVIQPTTWDRPYLTEETGDHLIRAFINHVDPFIRLIHVPKFFLDLNHFRRKVLLNPDQFEVELYAIYGLAVLSLSVHDVAKLGFEKSVLVADCKRYVESGLTWLKVTTTHDTSVLRIFLHFITLMFWTGEMVHANSLLGVAISIAYRLGVHRDGAQFHLPPLQVEMRRRMWHHIELLDAWSIENIGTETLLVPGLSDTMLPLNADDASWDISPFSSSPPKGQVGFTDMTIALIQYEVAAILKTVLKHGASKKDSDDKRFFEFHAQLFQQSKEKLEVTYLKHLDSSDIKQRLARHVAELGLSQIKLTQKRMGGKRVPPSEHADQMPEYEKNLYEESMEYCKKTRELIQEYEPYHFGWAILLQFSWHSLATMLSTVLRYHSLSDTPESRANRSRISGLFKDRVTIGYVSGNNNLWRLITQLCSELHHLELLDQTKNDEHGDHESTLFDLMTYLNGQVYVDDLALSEESR
ncbi:hypothetical protein V8C37DRAFT_364865 [Trichoderma ceciliae]